MKKDKLYWALEIAKFIFFLAIPVGLFIFKCTKIGAVDGGEKFITSCSGYIILLIVYFVFKKVLVANYIHDLSTKIVNFETQLETETDQDKIPLVEKALSKCLVIRTLFTVAPILLIAMLALVLVQAIETDLITLYNVLSLMSVSYLIGLVCQLVQSANVKSKNRR